MAAYIPIPVGPLMQALATAGGLRALPSLGKARIDVRPDGMEYVTYDRTLEQTRTLHRLERAVRRANAAGVVNLYLADEICCKHLCRHPAECFGSDWFEYGYETEEVTA